MPLAKSYFFIKKYFNAIFRRKERDLTQSCCDGIEKAKYKNILIMDADLQHDPKYIPKMLNLKRKLSQEIRLFLN